MRARRHGDIRRKNVIPLREADGWTTFATRVQPGAKRDGVVGIYGDALKVAVSAPAVDGRANEALIGVLAREFEVRRSDVELVSGATNRSKVVRVRAPQAAIAARIPSD